MSRIVTVKINKARFEKGLSYVKQFGGKYNSDSKTWTIDLNSKRVPESFEANPINWYLEIISSTPRAEQHDHNCLGRFGGPCECK